MTGFSGELLATTYEVELVGGSWWSEAIGIVTTVATIGVFIASLVSVRHARRSADATVEQSKAAVASHKLEMQRAIAEQRSAATAARFNEEQRQAQRSANLTAEVVHEHGRTFALVVSNSGPATARDIWIDGWRSVSTDGDNTVALIDPPTEAQPWSTIAPGTSLSVLMRVAFGFRSRYAFEFIWKDERSSDDTFRRSNEVQVR